MPDALPVVLVPGLTCSARLYAEQIPALWRFGPVIVADHTRDDSMASIARRILAGAPPRFALAGLSMGGYIAFEIMRQAPQRVARLALLDTGARAETPEQTERRKVVIALAKSGRYAEVPDIAFPIYVHRNRLNDADLKRTVRMMAEETGVDAFLRQQQAIMSRPDSRPGFSSIKCLTLVLVGDGDEATPPELAREIAGAITGARLVMIADCGHLSTLEQPEKVTAALVDWMKW
ncbi:MAG TPA: alpha/beta fold hydrolase [Xanthobacteraceae bacterium]|jgi:pimeloyl-ACP methyl ester carboxylesterase|nr:alpha/beta fold hydrolase [Xanthobacteraceae bacterium]